MELRRELTPPPLDEQLVSQLAGLADAMDGNPSEALRVEFNRLAGTAIPMHAFQGVYGSEDHAKFVRRVLRKELINPVPDISREELVEVVRRAMEPDRDGLQEAYMAVFDCTVPRPRASSLIFYPPDRAEGRNTWGDGKPMRDYDPSPEQIIDRALDTAACRR